VLFVLASLATCIASTMDASWLAIVVGAIAFALALIAPRVAVIAVVGGLMLYGMLAPVISTYVLTLDGFRDLTDPKWVGTITRIGIWHEAARLTAERPILGHGFDSTRILAAQATNIPGTPWPSLPLHTHNGFLQIWLELGAVGIALILAMFAAAARALWAMTTQPLALAVSLATLASTAVIALISFGIWQYWWLATWMLVAGLLQLAFRGSLTRA
jgi:O-antigen ligase